MLILSQAILMFYRLHEGFAGIDKESRTKVMTLIMRQLNDLKRGKFTESELQLTKEMLVNTTLLAQDRQNTLIEREYLKTILGKKVLSLEEWLESIDKVSREEIIEVAKQLIYSLFILWKESSVKIEN